MKEIRASQDQDDGLARKAARSVREKTLALPELATARSMLVCLSFGTELETRGLIEALIALGKEVYLPRIERATPDMTLHRFPCELERLDFGLEQPAQSVPAVGEPTPDLALILGLAFDQEGYRLGYGGGYFDRFLADSAGAGHPVLPIGLSFEANIVSAVPREPHDQPMQIVVSEQRVRRLLS